MKYSVGELKEALKKYGSVKKTAQEMGVPRSTLQRWLKKCTPPSSFIDAGDPNIVGIIPDLHAPAMLWEGIEWMVDIFKEHNVGKVICIGDLIDNHSGWKYDTYSDSLNPDAEWIATKEALQRLHTLIPKMTVLSGNHCRRIGAKASLASVPSDFMKSLGDVLNLDGWEFIEEVGVPYTYNGVNYIHGDGLGSPMNPALQAERMGGMLVSGHTHKMRLAFSSSALRTIWGMQVGCLIDSKHYSMRYGANMVSKLDLGCGVVIGHNPFLFNYEVQEIDED